MVNSRLLDSSTGVKLRDLFKSVQAVSNHTTTTSKRTTHVLGPQRTLIHPVTKAVRADQAKSPGQQV